MLSQIRLSVTRVDQSKTVEVRIMQFSGNITLGGNFWKFPLIVNITDKLGSAVDLISMKTCMSTSDY